MKKVVLLIGCFMCLTYNSILFAVTDSIKIDDYSYKDGLTTSFINNTFKDSRGFVWLCSINGLYRFDGYSFRKLNTLVDNVPHFEAHCIVEDSSHNLWIGADLSGIFFYNVHTEKVVHVQLDNKITGGIFNIIFFSGKMWVATSKGLHVITPLREYNENISLQSRVLLPDPSGKNPLSNVINAIYADQDNKLLWVGSASGLFVLNPENEIFTFINSEPQNAIFCFSKFNNKIVAGSWDGGIFGINPVSKTIENDSYIQQANKWISDKRIMSLCFDSLNRLWAATYGNGLYMFERKKNGQFQYENYRTNSKDQKNLKSDFINHMYLDNTGIIWLGMSQPALSKVYFQKSNLEYYYFTKPGSESRINGFQTISLSVDKNKLWVATHDQGIFIFDLHTHEYNNISDDRNSIIRLFDNDIARCYQDKKGNIWIVHRYSGLFVVPAGGIVSSQSTIMHRQVIEIDANKMLNIDSRENSYITCFYEDHSGRIWIGAWNSLYVVELKKNFAKAVNSDDLINESEVTTIFSKNKPLEKGIINAPVFSILEVRPYHFWVGTKFSGILLIKEVDRNIFTSELSEINNQLPGKNVSCTFMDTRKSIWIGTNSGLCCIDNEKNSLKIISEQDGLTSENIYNITEDKNSDIWFSTAYGISRIDPNTYRVNNFLFTDEESANQYIPNAVAISPEGFICFSSTNSVVIVNPYSINSNKSIPPLYFTDIKINNKAVIPNEKYNGTRVIDVNINECKEINVPYNHILRIEFAALDFVNSKSLFYKYRISEKSEWILLNSNQRSLTLQNMNAGEYTLSIMVAASNNLSTIKKIKLNYLPPIWRSKLAYLLYFTVILLLFLFYRKLTVQKILQASVIEKERYERKKLEELDKLKSDFFTSISHELRTPLTLIISPLEKLETSEELSDKSKNSVNLILKSSKRLLKLTNELMDFSKIEKKLLLPEFQLCDMASYLKEICQLFDNLADAMNIDFRLNFAFEKLEIHIDKGMIEKVIFNLLSNAFKYTPDNGMVMVNGSVQNNNGNEYLKISVINTGEGIKKENLDRIFDKFYQVNNIQNRNAEGTGIGLALVKSFVELHNGKVEVISEPNVETAFDIFLPLNQENILTTDEFDTTSDQINKYLKLNQGIKANDNKPASHYRILLVEDDDDIRNFIVNELSVDFKIASAKNGEEGIKLANEMIPDLIITDIIMPVLTGIELCRILKNQMVTSHIPIIILSAKTTITQQIEGLEMGADVYMIKPFNIDHLKTQIIRLIHFKEAIYSRYLKEITLIPSDAISNKLDEEFMKKTIAFIEENLSNVNLNVDQLANCVSLSKVQTYRKVKAITGQSIVEFIRTIRLKKATEMVLEKRLNFAEIAYETGFSSPSYFTKCFHDHFGKTPSEFVSDYGNKIE